MEAETLADADAYVYVLVRADLSLEQQLVQASHAALEAGFEFERPASTANLVLLSVENRGELELAAERLNARGIEHHLFYEPDFGIGHSALATRPLYLRSERAAFKRYRLFRAGSG
jgi:hypothetical protein